MLALQMFRSVSRTVAGKAIGGRMPGVLSGFAAPLRLVTIDEPRVDRPGWARLRTRLSGICGSDLGALSGRTSLYFSAVVSLPFVPGHEVVAELLEDCEDLPKGTRVVIDPVLTCAARGVDPCVHCADGGTNRCERITVGHLSPGLQTGSARTPAAGGASSWRRTAASCTSCPRASPTSRRSSSSRSRARSTPRCARGSAAVTACW